MRKGSIIRVWIEKNWFYLGMGAALALGYLWVDSGLWLGRRNKWLVAALMFLMGLGLSPRGIASQLRNLKALALFLLLSYVAAPLLAYGVAWTFFRRQEHEAIFTGIIIVGATATTLSSCIVWTRLAGGNEALALVMSILGNSLQALVTPAWLALLLGTAVGLPVATMMYGLFQIVLVPIIVSQVVAAILGDRALRAKPVTGVLARLLVLVVIWVAVSNAADCLISVTALTSSLAVVGVHIVLLTSSWWVFGRLLPSQRDRVALLFCAGQKTLPSSTHIATEYFANLDGAVLPVLLYHFWQLIIDSFLLEHLRPHQHDGGDTERVVSGTA